MRTRVADIVTIAARLAKIDRELLVTPCRKKPISRVRAAVTIVARDHGHSYPQIARRLGGMDHSSCIHYVRQEPIWRKFEPGFGELVDALRHEASLPGVMFTPMAVAA